MPTSTATALARSNLRDQTREALVASILRGDWPPGCRIPLAEVATGLGVSVTPVREALSQLVHEGLVVARQAHGFFVSETDIAQARQVYPILGALEALAVRSSPPFAEETLGALDAANERMQSAKDSSAARFDLQWHEALTCNCDNQLLLDKMAELRRRVALIEAAYMRRRQWRARSVDQHRSIGSSLRKGRQGQAAELLERHWRMSVDFVDQAGAGMTGGAR